MEEEEEEYDDGKEGSPVNFVQDILWNDEFKVEPPSSLK